MYIQHRESVTTVFTSVLNPAPKQTKILLHCVVPTARIAVIVLRRVSHSKIEVTPYYHQDWWEGVVNKYENYMNGYSRFFVSLVLPAGILSGIFGIFWKFRIEIGVQKNFEIFLRCKKKNTENLVKNPKIIFQKKYIFQYTLFENPYRIW